MAEGAVVAHRRREHAHRLEEGVDGNALANLHALEHLVAERHFVGGGLGSGRLGGNADLHGQARQPGENGNKEAWHGAEVYRTVLPFSPCWRRCLQ